MIIDPLVNWVDGNIPETDEQFFLNNWDQVPPPDFNQLYAATSPKIKLRFLSWMTKDACADVEQDSLNIIMGINGDGECLSWLWQLDPSSWECLNDGSCELSDPTMSLRSAYESEEDCLNNCGRGRWQCTVEKDVAVIDGGTRTVHNCLPSPASGTCMSYDECQKTLATGNPCPAPAPMSSDTIRLMYAHNKCIELVNGDTTNGNLVQIASCNGNFSQDWVFLQVNDVGMIQFKAAPTKCLDLSGGNWDNGTPLEIWDCLGNENQQFGFDWDSGAIYFAASGQEKCVDVGGNDATDGNALQLWDCYYGHSQLWNLGAPQTYHFTLLSNSGMCLDLAGGNTEDGSMVWLWECNGLPEQQWVFDMGSWKIQYAADRTKCLDLPLGLADNGSRLQLWTCNGFNTQQWGWDDDSKSIYYKAVPQKCIDLPNGGQTNGNRFEVWDCNGSPNQQWQLEDAWASRDAVNVVVA